MLNSRKQIEPYVPHSGTMLLIDRVVDYGVEHIVSEVDIGVHLPCYVDGQVPAYLGIEAMAQSIAVWAGIRRDEPDSRPPIGFLLGTRRFECTQAFFQVGSILKIRANYLLESEGLSMFECEMDEANGNGINVNVATANISVYLPPDSLDENLPDQNQRGLYP